MGQTQLECQRGAALRVTQIEGKDMRKSVHKLAEDLDLMLDTIVNPDRLMTCEKAAYQQDQS